MSSTNTLNQYSTVVANNTLIASTNINVGCAPQDVGVFMRTIMAQLAYPVQGSGGVTGTLVPENWYVGTIQANTGSIAGDLSVSGTLSAENVEFASLPALSVTGLLSGGTVASGGSVVAAAGIRGASGAITGALNAATLVASGAVSGASVAASGVASAATLAISGNGTISGTVVAGAVASVGPITSNGTTLLSLAAFPASLGVAGSTSFPSGPSNTFTIEWGTINSDGSGNLSLTTSFPNQMAFCAFFPELASPTTVAVVGGKNGTNSAAGHVANSSSGAPLTGFTCYYLTMGF